MISLKHKYIFIHVPRTGGSSVEQELLRLEGGYEHLQVNDHLWGFLNALPKLVKTKFKIGHGMQHRKLSFWSKKMRRDFFTFTFVRNPWDLVVSEYYWIHRHSKCKPWMIKYLKQRKISKFTFEQFVKSQPLLVKDKQTPGHNLPQSTYVDGTPDFVGKYEQLDEDWKSICKKLGFPEKDLPKVNISGPESQLTKKALCDRRKKRKYKDYRKYYTDEIAELVAKRYVKDIKRFNYEF